MAQALFINSSVTLVSPNQMPQVSHEFLISREIVSDGFVVRPGGSISIPQLSQIEYANGFQISIEQNSKAMFQVFLGNQDTTVVLSHLKLLQKVSSSFVDCFKNISYQAVGINFDVIGRGLRYNSLMQKLAKTDITFDDSQPDVNDIHLSYAVQGKQANIQIVKMEETDPNVREKNFVPLFKINMHYSKNYTDNVINIFNEIEKNYQQSKEFVEKLQ